jgi:hypothetical protein
MHVLCFCRISTTASTSMTSQPLETAAPVMSNNDSDRTSSYSPLRTLLADENNALRNGEVVHVKRGVSIQMLQTDRG